MKEADYIAVFRGYTLPDRLHFRVVADHVDPQATLRAGFSGEAAFQQGRHSAPYRPVRGVHGDYHVEQRGVMCFVVHPVRLSRVH
jgi:hypothetical protein